MIHVNSILFAKIWQKQPEGFFRN